MTIEEAIKHCEEQAQKHCSDACSHEHKQLANWLKELVELRKIKEIMNLQDYTTEDLKAELKRRAEINRQRKAEEMKIAKRCRNCKFCKSQPISAWGTHYICTVREWGKIKKRNYAVNLSDKACDKFERINDFAI